MPAARTAWARFGPAHDAVLHSARSLDTAVRMSLAAGLEISAEQLALLHRSYWAAFVASRIKGMADRAAEEGDDFQPAPSASPAVGGAAGTEGQPLLTADRARRLQQAAIVRASALLVSMGNASAMSARRS